ncbi:MAG: hypothetical protein U1U88_000328 [Lawsonella clevelandensis]
MTNQGSPYFATAETAVAQMSHDEEHGVPPSKVVDVIVKMMGRESPHPSGSWS